MSSLTPNTYLDPFDCSILPPPFCAQCKQQKIEFRRTSPGSCSRLPPQYQALCRAIPPSDPVNNFGDDYNPADWPNSASSSPASFAARREMCNSFPGVGVARGFYNCLWGQNNLHGNLVNTARFPCPPPNDDCYPSLKDNALVGQWEKIEPTGQYQTPKVWIRK